MKKWITLFVCLLFTTAVLMAGGCSKKEDPTKPAATVAKLPEPEKKAEGAKPAEAKPATQIMETITKYWNAFNANDLETVMICFNDEAVYQPGDGKTHKGKAEIRAAFEPQFNAAFGSMQFDELDRLIDVENRKMAIRYICRHDISHMKPRGLGMTIRKIYAGLIGAERFGWHGVDVFHFDPDGKIKEKYSYGWFGSDGPQLQRELG